MTTTNIFTVDILSGARTDRFLETQLTNNPPLIPSLGVASLLTKIGPAFKNDEPDFRREIQKAFEQNPQGLTMSIDISNTPLERAAKS